MEGMDMAEEMGIFIVNIASERQKRLPAPKNAPVPIPQSPNQQAPPAIPPPKPANGNPSGPAAAAIPTAQASAPAAAIPMGGHSHGGRKMIRSPRFGMIDLPESAFPVSVIDN
jgi:hypothetical protein